MASTDIRNAAGHNLSFAAHMTCLETLTKEMGIYTLYLATDNNTLFDEAARWFPQYLTLILPNLTQTLTLT